MDDRDYAQLDPATMGFRFVGSVPSDQQGLLTDALRLARAVIGDEWQAGIDAQEIFWLNLWQNGGEDDVVDVRDEALKGRLNAWCHALVAHHGEAGAIIDGYGFVINPRGSEAQVWHIDYTTDCACLWIPITPFTTDNSTQFVTLPEMTPRDALERVAQGVDEVDLAAIAQAAGHLGVQQVVAQPMSILSMGRGTIHRGVGNTGADDRIAFYVSMHFIRDYGASYPYGFVGFQEAKLVTFAD